jgi:hypothetical protein
MFTVLLSHESPELKKHETEQRYTRKTTSCTCLRDRNGDGDGDGNGDRDGDDDGHGGGMAASRGR